MEVCNIVQEVVTKTIPKKNKCEKAKWLPEEALKTAEKIKEVNSKQERERYTQLNVDFQRIARRDKKVFISEQCKIQRKTNRIVTSIDLFKKSGDTRGTLHGKIGTIKDIKVKDLTEADEIKKRWQECTEGLYKKDLHDPDNHDSVITHLEPDILECEVKWALGSITTNKPETNENSWSLISEKPAYGG